MTVQVSQNNSGVSKPGVIRLPLKLVRKNGSVAYNRRRDSALCTHPNVAARCILDGGQRVAADAARSDFLGVDAGEPFAPMRPPGALVLLCALQPVLQGDVVDVVVGPVLIF